MTKDQCQHDWSIWPETDGLEQRCRKCGAYRNTPPEDQFWKRSSAHPEAAAKAHPEAAQAEPSDLDKVCRQAVWDSAEVVHPVEDAALSEATNIIAALLRDTEDYGKPALVAKSWAQQFMAKRAKAVRKSTKEGS